MGSSTSIKSSEVRAPCAEIVTALNLQLHHCIRTADVKHRGACPQVNQLRLRSSAGIETVAGGIGNYILLALCRRRGDRRGDRSV